MSAAAQPAQRAAATAPRPDLPRLLYVSDVPAEAGLGGSAIVYRLLRGYPPARLTVVESSLRPSTPGARLPGVRYRRLFLGPQRLTRSRLASLYAGLLVLTPALQAPRLDSLVRREAPDAVLTVVHGFAWMLAARLAIRHGQPLHLLIHDDWTSTHGLGQPFAGLAYREFRRAYAYASSRLCVSPAMAERYTWRYAAPAAVLYPPRSIEAPEPAEPYLRPGRREGPVTFTYAGSLHSPAYVDAVAALAAAARPVGARLVIYAPPFDAARLLRPGNEHVSVRPALPAERLLDALRGEADVLFVPMSFAPWDGPNMAMGFPSKLADYTAAGLPLLIWGPASCSAARWARENHGAAELVDAQDAGQLAQAVARLAADPAHRERLAAGAVRVGNRLFTYRAVAERFYGALTRPGVDPKAR